MRAYRESKWVKATLLTRHQKPGITTAVFWKPVSICFLLTLSISKLSYRRNGSIVIAEGGTFSFLVDNFQHAHGVLNIDGCLPWWFLEKRISFRAKIEFRKWKPSVISSIRHMGETLALIETQFRCKAELDSVPYVETRSFCHQNLWFSENWNLKIFITDLDLSDFTDRKWRIYHDKCKSS